MVRSGGESGRKPPENGEFARKNDRRRVSARRRFRCALESQVCEQRDTG
jgi:hypothetical protein